MLSKKHGVCNLCYTHAPQAVIHASNKVGLDSAAGQWHPEEASVFRSQSQASLIGMQGLDHTLRYLSLHDNRYLRYFKGHTQQVTTLCLSPKNDLFMSAAQVRAQYLQC